MAEIPVTRDVLETTAAALKEQADALGKAAQEIESVFPQGFTLFGPPLNDSLPALLEFTAEVKSRIDVAKMEKVFGVSAKTKRSKRYLEKKADNGGWP